jgi:magnesium transporter
MAPNSLAQRDVPASPEETEMRVSDLILPDVKDALRGDIHAIRDLVEELHPADTAEVFLSLEPEEGRLFLKALPVQDQVALLEELEAETRAEIVEQITPDVAARIVEEMSPDERADLFRELPENVAAKLLAKIPREEARDVQSLLAWPEGTVGSRMTTDFLSVSAESTVGEAIEHIRRVSEEMETIYYAYALSPEGFLRGVVSLRQLVISRPERRIAEVMDSDHLITVRPEADQVEAARLISKYDFLAVPVVDAEGKMLGIVTVDDVVDVVEEEATEDAQKMAAVAPLEDSYFKAGFVQMVKSRVGWLTLLFLGELITGSALQHYEASFESALALVYFIPLIVSSGGNSGSQSAGLMIRALARGEVVPSQAWRVALREMSGGLVLGAILGGIGVARALLWPGVGAEIAVVVGCAVLFVVLFGAVIGALLPLAIQRVGLDPAVSSAPMIASLVDVAGIVIYFQVAKAVLDLP